MILLKNALNCAQQQGTAKRERRTKNKVGLLQHSEYNAVLVMSYIVLFVFLL